jgi:phage anti-repressor protein
MCNRDTINKGDAMSNLVNVVDFTVDVDTPFPVSARDLWKGLESKDNFSNWIIDQVKRGRLEENKDYLLSRLIPNNSPQRGRPSKEYQFTLNAAEHIALISNTEKGSRYRQALIDIKNKVLGQEPVNKIEAFDDATTVTENSMKICKLFGIPESRAQSITKIKVLELTGVNLSSYLLEAPAQNNIQDDDIWLEPKDLAIKYGLTSATMVNKALAKAGMQIKENGSWVPMSHCKQHTERHQWTKGGKSGYNLKWRDSFIRSIL